MKNPTKVKVKNKIYSINSDFRVAIECNEISQDETIGDYERALAIIYKLFGEEALKDSECHEELLEKAIKFLSYGIEVNKNTKQDPDMDFKQDEGLIKSSFKYDYKYDPYSLEYLHWWDFFNDLANLSNNELGNCCVLNRVRTLRTYDTSKIKDPKEKRKIEEAKKQFALKKKQNAQKLTSEQIQNIQEFKRLTGLN